MKTLQNFLGKVLLSLVICGSVSYCQPASSEVANQMILALSGYAASLGLSTVKCQTISDNESSNDTSYFFLWLAKDSPMTDIQCKGESIMKIESFSFEPKLPEGIETRSEEGKLFLTGTPSTETEETEYLVELVGSGKKEIGRFTIKISSSDNNFFLQPNSIKEFPKGVSDSMRIGSVGGGKSVQVSFAPLLLSGISYEPKSGTLSGSTDASLGLYSHTISAFITDSEGTRPDVIHGSMFSLAVVPSRITYANNTYYFPTNKQIEIQPETRSFSSATYTIENGVVLPGGLTFQSTDGRISGITPNYEWKSPLEIKGTNSLGNVKFQISTFEILSPEKMKCNTTGVAAGCSKGSPYSCAATIKCYTSFNACKMGLINGTPSQF